MLPQLHLPAHPLQHLLAHRAPLERLHVTLEVRAEHLRHVPSDLRHEVVDVEVRDALLDRAVRLSLLRLGEEGALGEILDLVHHRVVARLPPLPRILQHLLALPVRRGLLQALELAEHGRDVRAEARLLADALPRRSESRLFLLGDRHGGGALVGIHGPGRDVPGLGLASLDRGVARVHHRQPVLRLERVHDVRHDSAAALVGRLGEGRGAARRLGRAVAELGARALRPPREAIGRLLRGLRGLVGLGADRAVDVLRPGGVIIRGLVIPGGGGRRGSLGRGLLAGTGLLARGFRRESSRGVQRGRAPAREVAER